MLGVINIEDIKTIGTRKNLFQKLTCRKLEILAFRVFDSNTVGSKHEKINTTVGLLQRKYMIGKGGDLYKINKGNVKKDSLRFISFIYLIIIANMNVPQYFIF